MRAGLLVAMAVAVMAAATLLLVSAADAGKSKKHRSISDRHGKLFGFSGIRPVGDLTPGLTTRLLRGVSGDASRTAIHWQAFEPQRDVLQTDRFIPYEHLYKALRAEHVKPIFLIQYAPAWARDAGKPRRCGNSEACHYPPANAMLGEWKEFVAEVVRRFPKAAIEVWNEPNYVGQWQPKVDPARYVRLLAAADQAAAAVNPRTRVYAGGLGTATKDRSLTAPQFLRAAYRASPSLKGHTDAINFHVFPAHGLGPGTEFSHHFASIRAARDAAGDRKTPLLISEMGRTTSGPYGVTEKVQADLLVRAVRRVLAARDVLGVLVYTLADRDEFPASNSERGFGVVRPGAGGGSYQPKAAYCALRRAAGFRKECRPGRDSSKPNLKAKVKPRRASVRPGGKPRRFAVRVKARHASGKIKRVRVCVRSGSGSVSVAGRRCKRAGTLRPGRRVKAAFRVGLRRGAPERAQKLRFVATGRGALKGRAQAKLRPR